MGRQIRPDCRIKRGKNLYYDFNLIKTWHKNNGCRLSLDGFVTGKNNRGPAGIKNFWRSDYMVDLKSGSYMMSVKTHGRFVKKIESINGENLKGSFLNDGVCLIRRNGYEYRNIAPLWNWTMLPGITCDTTINPADRRVFKTNNVSGFVGQISGDNAGISAMRYSRLNIRAYKSYFFVNNMAIFLGTGLNAPDMKNLVTTVDQRYYFGNKAVSVKSKNSKNAMIWQDSTAYFFPGRQDVNEKIELRKGDWINVDRARGHITVEDSLLFIYIGHERNNSYSYAVKPGIGESEAVLLNRRLPFDIISNTVGIQAVKAGNILMAVFYRAGELKISDHEFIKTDKPCMLIFKNVNGRKDLCVSDPTRTLKEIKISLNGKSAKIEMPAGELLGSTKEYTIY